MRVQRGRNYWAEAYRDHIHMLVSNTAQVHSVGHGVSQREKQCNDIREICESQVQVWKPVFLVSSVLCGHSRKK